MNAKLWKKTFLIGKQEIWKAWNSKPTIKFFGYETLKKAIHWKIKDKNIEHGSRNWQATIDVKLWTKLSAGDMVNVTKFLDVEIYRHKFEQKPQGNNVRIWIVHSP